MHYLKNDYALFEKWKIDSAPSEKIKIDFAPFTKIQKSIMHLKNSENQFFNSASLKQPPKSI